MFYEAVLAALRDAGIRYVLVGGVAVITMKEHAGRPQDLADVDALRRILDGISDG